MVQALEVGRDGASVDDEIRHALVVLVLAAHGLRGRVHDVASHGQVAGLRGRLNSLNQRHGVAFLHAKVRRDFDQIELHILDAKLASARHDAVSETALPFGGDVDDAALPRPAA